MKSSLIFLVLVTTHVSAAPFEKLRCVHSAFVRYSNELSIDGDAVTYQSNNLRNNYMELEAPLKNLLAPLNLSSTSMSSQDWKVTAHFDLDDCRFSSKMLGDFKCVSKDKGELSIRGRDKTYSPQYDSLSVTAVRTKQHSLPGLLFTLSVNYSKGGQAKVSGRPHIFQEEFSESGVTSTVGHCFINDNLELIK